MLTPKRTKYRKQQKGKIKGMAQRGHTLSHGSFGLKAIDPALVNSRQIEAARIALNRFLRREGKVWIRVFPDKPITEKPAEVRMGKGKGSPEYWAVPIKPGRIMFEVEGVREADAQEAMRLAAQKLPIKTKFVVHRNYAR